MDSNTHSAQHSTSRLAAHDLDRLADALADQVLQLRRLLDRLQGQWLKEPAGVDGHRAAGADHGTPAPSTANWLRNRLRVPDCDRPLAWDAGHHLVHWLDGAPHRPGESGLVVAGSSAGRP